MHSQWISTFAEIDVVTFTDCSRRDDALPKLVSVICVHFSSGLHHEEVERLSFIDNACAVPRVLDHKHVERQAPCARWFCENPSVG